MNTIKLSEVCLRNGLSVFMEHNQTSYGCIVRGVDTTNYIPVYYDWGIESEKNKFLALAGCGVEEDLYAFAYDRLVYQSQNQ